MADLKEAAVIKQLRDCAKKAILDGVESFKIHNGIYSGSTGFPDLIFLFRGKSLFIEAKTRTGKLTANQKATHSAMRKVGSAVWVAKPTKTKYIYEFTAQVAGGKFVKATMDISRGGCWSTLLFGPDVNNAFPLVESLD